MILRTVTIITSRDDREFYNALSIEGSQLQFIDFNEVEVSFSLCRCSVLILDCGFSPSSGLELLSRIKLCCTSIPIVFLTDASSEDLAIAAFKTGVQEYFRKPVRLFQLQSTIEKLHSPNPSFVAAGIPGDVLPPFGTGAMGQLVSSGLPSAVLRAVRHLNDHLTERVVLDVVAREAGMSKYHFCRMFKEAMGVTPMQFLTIRRIEHARLLMGKQGVSIAVIAYKSGFGTVSEFNRQFKRIVGMPPSYFRAALKKTSPEFEHT